MHVSLHRLMSADPFLTTIAKERFALSDDDLARLQGGYQSTAPFAIGEDVCRSDQADHIHVLQDGWACKYALLPDGRRQIVTLHLPGDVLDLDRIHGSGITCDVFALSACRVARIATAWVRNTTEKRPAIRALFMTLMADENRALAAHVISLGRRTARERIAYYFCDLLARLHAIRQMREGRFINHLSQSEMGDMLGLSAVHVNRSLGALRTEGLLQNASRWYTVPDIAALQHVALWRDPQSPYGLG